MVPQRRSTVAEGGGLLLLGLLIFSTLIVGFLTIRSATKDNEDADVRAQELERSILDVANADRSLFFGNAVFINGSIKVPVQIDRASVGDNLTTTYSEVRVGRASRCVIVRVHAVDPPLQRDCQEKVLNSNRHQGCAFR